MLSLAPISARQGVSYFAGDGRISEAETQFTSSWYGQGATALELINTPVKREIFAAVLEGHAPDGQRLLGKKIDPQHHQAGTDLTFSTPKSISMAALWGGDERLIRAHQQAVDRTLDAIEQDCSWTRISERSRQIPLLTGNLLIARFHHRISRANDPQLVQ